MPVTASPSQTLESSPSVSETFAPSLTPTKKVTLTATVPILDIGSVITSEKDGMVMVYVPAGSFTMGTDNGYAHEGPAHDVYLDSFWIDQTEVTDKQYALCLADGGCTDPLWQGGYSPDYFSEAQYVNWMQAKSYCEWAGKRLPTEAEWEKAARGTEGRVYPWGDEAPNCRLANIPDCVGGNPSPIFGLSHVGNYPDGVSPYGVYDMIGNVWEWVADWYGENYYAESPERNPPGPASGTLRLLRGGSIYQIAKAVTRTWTSPDKPQAWPYGFRCVQDVNP
jgi:formylglycine-generating enzyme required for sulfatase activity